MLLLFMQIIGYTSEMWLSPYFTYEKGVMFMNKLLLKCFIISIIINILLTFIIFALFITIIMA